MKNYPDDTLAFFRAGFAVRRFHTRSVVVENTVGAHTAGVIAMLLLLHNNGFVPPALLRAALIHDLPEAELGDIPAPAKRALNTTGELDRAEVELFGKYGLVVPLTEEEHRLLKLADMADALAYIAEERRLGNQGLNDIADRYWLYWADVVDDTHPTERALGCALAKLHGYPFPPISFKTIHDDRE